MSLWVQRPARNRSFSETLCALEGQQYYFYLSLTLVTGTQFCPCEPFSQWTFCLVLSVAADL